jgi:hypothetical protein
MGGWVGPRAVLDAVVKRKIPSPRRESEPRTPIVQPVAQRYTDWAIRALPLVLGDLFLVLWDLPHPTFTMRLLHLHACYILSPSHNPYSNNIEYRIQQKQRSFVILVTGHEINMSFIYVAYIGGCIQKFPDWVSNEINNNNNNNNNKHSLRSNKKGYSGKTH